MIKSRNLNKFKVLIKMENDDQSLKVDTLEAEEL